MRGHGSKFPRKKQAAIAALLEHPTVREAAEAVKIGESTLLRWMQDPAFKAAYRSAKQQIVNHSITRLQQATGEAVDTLREIMKDKDKPPSPRVTAAKAILDIVFKAIEIEDIQSRLEDLERMGSQ